MLDPVFLILYCLILLYIVIDCSLRKDYQQLGSYTVFLIFYQLSVGSENIPDLIFFFSSYFW